ncbi:MAG: hypothetical protein IJJ77_02620 [Paludibacteraceae bacterium]|nr:hypothetical protein [Paludibacteraceae bacterium]
MLRKSGASATDAQKQISGISNADKNELLFSHGINYNNLPMWQRRGVVVIFTHTVSEALHGRERAHRDMR